MQRDAKMVSYKVVDKGAKPYVEVDVAGEKKVRSQAPGGNPLTLLQIHLQSLRDACKLPFPTLSAHPCSVPAHKDRMPETWLACACMFCPSSQGRDA